MSFVAGDRVLVRVTQRGGYGFQKWIPAMFIAYRRERVRVKFPGFQENGKTAAKRGVRWFKPENVKPDPSAKNGGA